ncbi:hypothetical protein ACIQPT_29865 [Streptomyces sp. NPDC091289]|uniref:hypothetical protein n=1 Tax=Streptomyces sp. NPDC091289 TaxID=3365989 RepID=UPI0037FCA456
MADGFIQWYREAATAAAFAEQVALFAEFGIRIVHPVRGAAMVLDIEGDDVLMRPEELGSLLGLRIASLTFNWWLTSDTNVIDAYAPEALGRETQTLWLDGLCPDEAQRVEAAVASAATRLPVPTRAVIVDRYGISDPDDWDALALYDGTDIPVLPDRVIAQEPIAERILRAAAPGLTREEEAGGLVRLAPVRPA